MILSEAFSEMSDNNEDLPLSANFKQLSVEHYSLKMFCDLEKNTLESSVLLSIRSGPMWRGETQLVLDCSDLEIQDVRAAPEEDETTNVLLLEEPEVTGKQLEFSLNMWSLTICLLDSDKERLKSGHVISVVVTYRTQPESRSVHWRQIPDGSPCVYTAAASINNRGLFPCQVNYCLYSLPEVIFHEAGCPRSDVNMECCHLYRQKVHKSRCSLHRGTGAHDQHTRSTEKTPLFSPKFCSSYVYVCCRCWMLGSKSNRMHPSSYKIHW